MCLLEREESDEIKFIRIMVWMRVLTRGRTRGNEGSVKTHSSESNQEQMMKKEELETEACKTNNIDTQHK